jgi:hypothetical protein
LVGRSLYPRTEKITHSEKTGRKPMFPSRKRQEQKTIQQSSNPRLPQSHDPSIQFSCRQNSPTDRREEEQTHGAPQGTTTVTACALLLHERPPLPIYSGVHPLHTGGGGRDGAGEVIVVSMLPADLASDRGWRSSWSACLSSSCLFHLEGAAAQPSHCW